MQGLRNHSLHRSLPFTSVNFSVTPGAEPEFECDVSLGTERLLEWRRWSAADRAFVASNGDAIRLLPLVTKHGALVDEFNYGLANALIRSNDLTEVNALRIELNAAMMGIDIEQARRMTERLTEQRNAPAGMFDENYWLT